MEEEVIYTEEELTAAGYRKYYGKDIDVFFNPKLCTHSTYCLRGDHNVFNVKHRPWILPDNADYNKIIEIVRSCPSGALRYIVRKDILKEYKMTLQKTDGRIWLDEEGKGSIGELIYTFDEQGDYVVESIKVSFEHQGKGLAWKLLENLIVSATQEGKKIVAHCPYAKAQLTNKEQYKSMLKEG